MGEILPFTYRPVTRGESVSFPTREDGNVVLFEAPMSAPSQNPGPWVEAARRVAEDGPDTSEWMTRFSQAVQASADQRDPSED